MGKRFKQLIKLQSEQTTLIERELTICRIAEWNFVKNKYFYESQTEGFNVTYTEERGAFCLGGNMLWKFKVMDRSDSVIGVCRSEKEAEEILADFGDTKIEYNEAEEMWTIKRGNITAICDATVIKHSYPYVSGEGEEDE